jgi:hypothetical protein
MEALYEPVPFAIAFRTSRSTPERLGKGENPGEINAAQFLQRLANDRIVENAALICAPSLQEHGDYALSQTDGLC